MNHVHLLPPLRSALLVGGVLIMLSAAAVASEVADPADPIGFFEQHVEPILKEHCFKCHGREGNPKGGLRLTSRQGVLAGGDTGPAVSLEAPRESLLLQAVNYEGYEMPPGGKLPEAKIEVLRRWVEMGLPWTPGDEADEPQAATHGPPQVTEEAKQFWSFRPATRPTPPAVGQTDWVSNPIDAFVLQRLEAAGLSPAPPAAKGRLIRRAYYDLTGLPPSPADVTAFLNDPSPDAYERLVDHLLESPHYGERWARHWLDLVRYAETNSYERDGAKPFVWRFRDYVIRSFNADKPYDRFIFEQLAGDELSPLTPDALIATGYYRLGLWQDEPVDAEQELFEDLDDLVRTTGEVFLGLTIGCARCHDHKLDPLPQSDYYRFLAFFRNVRRFGVRSDESVFEASVRTVPAPEEPERYAVLLADYHEQVKANQAAIEPIEARLVSSLQGVEQDEWKTEDARLEIAQSRVGRLLTEDEFARYTALFAQRKRLRASEPPALMQALCIKEHGREAPPTYVLVRGNAHVRGEQVEPGFPRVLSPPPAEVILPAEDIESTGRRLALARWIASADNPLTSRVMVNRIWQHHFGRGIVRTSSDFGFQGLPPTHPELLDWLASELVAQGWRLKPLHRLIMMSSTYRMSSHGDPAALERDPTNDLLWRFDPRRLSAEEIRDSILAVNGSLNRQQMFGPSVYTRIPDEVLAGQSRPGSGWGESSPEDQARRTIYVHVKRSLLVPMVASFDGPDTDFSCPVRFQTTQPTQALGMLNSAFIQDQAALFANDLGKRDGDAAPPERESLVRDALWRVWQRPPMDDEVERGVRLLESLESEHALPPETALKQFCVMALNLNEFVYLD